MGKQYVLHRKQEAAILMMDDPEVNQGGLLMGKRGGKSIGGSTWSLKMLCERSNELGAIFSPTSTQLTHFTLAEFKNVLTSHNLFQDVHYVVNKNPKEKFGYESRFPMDHYGVWSFYWGAQVYTFSIESFFMGAEFGWCWGDEIQEMTKAALDEVTLRMSGSKKPKTFYTFTPPRNNPDIEAMVYHPEKDEPGTGSLKLVVGTTYDNKRNLEPEYLKGLERLDPLTFQRDVMCRRVRSVEFPWLYPFKRSIHVSEKAVRREHEMVYVSFDFNNNPFVCTLSHRGRHPNGKQYIHYFDGVELLPTMVTGTFIEAMVQQIWQKTPTQAANNLYMITGDTTGRKQDITMRVGENIWTEIMKHMRVSSGQFRLQSTNPLNKDAKELCCAIFANSEKPDGIEVLINPKLEGLIFDCEYVQTKPDGTMVKDSRSKDDQRADWMDALKYDLSAFNYDYFIH